MRRNFIRRAHNDDEENIIRFNLLIAVLLVSACASMGDAKISEPSESKVQQEARISLDYPLATSLEAGGLRSQSKAILVFPDIFKAGLLVGGAGGNGVLFSPDGRVLGYYNMSAASYGLQIGAQDFSEAIFFTSYEALNYLDDSNGWSIGAGPNIVVVDKGAGMDFSSIAVRSGVYAFIYGRKRDRTGANIKNASPVSTHADQGGVGVSGD